MPIPFDTLVSLEQLALTLRFPIFKKTYIFNFRCKIVSALALFFTLKKCA